LIERTAARNTAATGHAVEPALGGDGSFGKAQVQAVLYGRLGAHWGYGLRADVRYAWGNMPFFMRPGLDMRGLTRGRYLGKVAVLTEAEPRYWLDERWLVLVFGGLGRVASSWGRSTPPRTSGRPVSACVT
jgi:hypothetical protein